ncbi:MAG: diguanylate cyclase [Firmicutes bacterium]|nr:diguanylate cyclase [Bacillota bacterium]
MPFLSSFTDVLIELIRNSVLLFALVFVYGATNFKPKEKLLNKKILLGLIIGGFSVLIMLNPWTSAPGLIFDTRSVLLSVTGMFFGWGTTLISVVISMVYRIIVGGAGVYAGVLTIITTASVGLSWKHIRKLIRKLPRWLEYYLFGVIVHIVTLLCQLAIPWPGAFDVIASIALPFLGLFPIVTMVLAISIDNQIDRLSAHEELINSKLLLESSIDSAVSMEIYALDRKLNYLVFNQYHQLSMEKYYNLQISIGHSFLDMIEDDEMRYRLESFFKKALEGEAFSRILEVETTRGKFLEEHYSPIRDSKGDIIGITVFSQDITDRKKYEESILYLSYHDALTGLFNRRFYMEELARLDRPEFYPLSVVMSDINGLKIMNDAFGHDAGDELLKLVSDELKKAFGNHGEVARIGGDEFVVLLKNTSKIKTANMVETAKRHIEENELNGMRTSVSFGFEVKDDRLSMAEVIKLAEDDMYKHKLFEVTSNRNEAIRTVLHTLHVKNPREEVHSRRVSEYCFKIGQAVGLRKDELDLLKVIGNLHDIGKIAIDESILNKPGTLSSEEWAAIKRHSEIGYRILSSSPEYTEIALDILSHHEHFDGTGYPQGLSGNDIPFRARIISIADAFDAMTSERSYRKAMKIEEALKEIERCAGTQFDPFITGKFVEAMRNKSE